LFNELWQRKVRDDIGPYLAFYGHTAWHDDDAENQAQNDALRWERLDDLHPLSLEGTKEEKR
jgi:hypothetical protein